MNTLEVIEHVFYNESGKSVEVESPNLGDWDREAINLYRTAMRGAKKFLLDVEKTQSFYDDLHIRPHEKSVFNSFELPFDKTLIAFKDPLSIIWNKPDTLDYIETEVLGFYVFPYLKPTIAEGVQTTTGRKGKIVSRTYRLLLFMIETEGTIESMLPDYTGFRNSVSLSEMGIMLGYQYIQFVKNEIIFEDESTLYLTSTEHYPFVGTAPTYNRNSLLHNTHYSAII